MQTLGIRLQSSCQVLISLPLPQRPTRRMLILGMINLGYCPRHLASAFTSSILLTTFASPTLEYARTLPFALMDVFLYCNTGIDACNKLFRPVSPYSCDTQSNVAKTGLNFSPLLLTTQACQHLIKSKTMV